MDPEEMRRSLTALLSEAGRNSPNLPPVPEPAPESRGILQLKVFTLDPRTAESGEVVDQINEWLRERSSIGASTIRPMVMSSSDRLTVVFLYTEPGQCGLEGRGE